MKRSMLAALAFIGLAAAGARAHEGEHDARSRGGLSFGLRGSYYDPNDGRSDWMGGGQLRFHLGPVVALEGSTDYRQDNISGSVIDVFPVQASLLIYLTPQYRVSPYLLGGGGWYYTHVRGGATDNRFGPHAGAGLQFWMNHHWSIDGSYRYLWISDYQSQTRDRPLGTNISDRGHQVTAAINYRF